eukprot:313247-Pelagomonas_calceolata.AAC.5
MFENQPERPALSDPSTFALRAVTLPHHASPLNEPANTALCKLTPLLTLLNTALHKLVNWTNMALDPFQVHRPSCLVHTYGQDLG